jgi:hypothetical protein
MQRLTGDEIKRSFANSSRSRVKAMTPPVGLAELDWESHDYLGWRDAKAPGRAYLVTPHGSDVVGLELAAPTSTDPRRGTGLCELCRSAHPADGVNLFVARKAGAAGRQGNSVGTYICADLACSLYVRGLRKLELPQRESLGTPERIERLRNRLAAFVERALDGRLNYRTFVK